MTPTPAVSPISLAALERRLRQDLAWLDIPAKRWVAGHANDDRMLPDAVVIGGGMVGMAAAAALKHLGVRTRIYDKARQGFEGPWATTARMETLRSPKSLTGPALGVPSLTFRAWFEAQYGEAAWDALDKIPRLQWMDYLRWYRRVMDLDVRNEHRVSGIRPHPDHVELTIESPAGSIGLTARHVVLATGRAGLGGPFIPGFVNGIDRRFWAHSSDAMDYERLRGLRVGVIGAGASAMDSAATALEHGAASVDLLVRRQSLPRINKGMGVGSPGFTHGYPHLPDDWKWRIRHYINAQRVPPPRASVLRVSRHDNAFLNLQAAVLDVALENGRLAVRTSYKSFTLDFLILATGFRVDWEARPEFAAIAPHVRLWGDRYRPNQGEDDDELSNMPDLGPDFEFQGKPGHPLPGLSRIHCLCYPATLTHGAVAGDIPAVSAGAQRLARGMASRLFREGIDQYYGELEAFDEPELLGDEWKRTT